MKKIAILTLGSALIGHYSFAQDDLIAVEATESESIPVEEQAREPHSLKLSYGYYDFKADMTTGTISDAFGTYDGEGELDGQLHGFILTYGYDLQNNLWGLGDKLAFELAYTGGSLDGSVDYDSVVSTNMEQDREEFELKFLIIGNHEKWAWNTNVFFQYVNNEFSENFTDGSIWAETGTSQRSYDEAFYNWGAGAGIGYVVYSRGGLVIVPKIAGSFALGHYDEDSTNPGLDTDTTQYFYTWEALVFSQYQLSGNLDDFDVFGELGYKQVGHFEGDDSAISSNFRGVYARIGLNYRW